jgi:hypothetical protein
MAVLPGHEGPGVPDHVPLEGDHLAGARLDHQVPTQREAVAVHVVEDLGPTGQPELDVDAVVAGGDDPLEDGLLRRGVGPGERDRELQTVDPDQQRLAVDAIELVGAEVEREQGLVRGRRGEGHHQRDERDQAGAKWIHDL